MGIIKKQGIRNSIISYIGIAIGFVNLIILQPIFLSTEEIGLTRILFSSSYLISCLIPMGVGNIITRYFPLFRNEEKKHHGFMGLVSLFMLVGTIVAGLSLLVFKTLLIEKYKAESPLFVEYAYLIFPFSVILGIVAVLNMYAYSLYKTIYATILNDIIVKLASIVLFSIYFLKLISLNQLVMFFVGIYGLQALALIIFIQANNAFHLKIDFKFLNQHNIKDMLKFAAVFSLAPFASFGIKFMDGIILGQYKNLDIVGVYAIMTFIPSFIETPLLALEKIANPKIADALIRNDLNEIKDIYYKSCRYLMLFGGLLLIMIYTNSVYLISFMKPEFMKGLNVIYIISLSTTFNLYTGTNNAIVYNSSNYLFGTILLFVIMILTILLNYTFIPIWGMEGAAIATSLAGLTFNFSKFIFIKIKFNFQPIGIQSIKIFLVTLFSLAILYILPEANNIYVSAIYKSIIVGTCYLGLNFILKTFNIQEFIPNKK